MLVPSYSGLLERLDCTNLPNRKIFYLFTLNNFIICKTIENIFPNMEVKRESVGIRTARTFRSLTRTVFFVCAIYFYAVACLVCISVVYSIYVLFRKMGFKMEGYKIAVGTFWAKVTQSLLCILMGDNTTIVYKNEEEKDTENSLSISNHSTYLDWIYLWAFHIARKRKNVSFVAKAGVKDILFISLGIKMLNFVLLSRNMEQDKELLEKACADLKKKKGYNLVLFPEGTFIDPNTKAKDHEFYDKEMKKKEAYRNADDSERRHLEQPKPWIREPSKNVIFPRTKGFKCLLDHLNESISWIKNFTIFYDVEGGEKIYPSEKINIKNLLLGKCSLSRVLIICDHIKVTPDIDIIKNPEQGIFDIFKKKDKQLEEISEKRESFPEIVEEYRSKGYICERLHPSIPITTFLTTGTVFTISGTVYLLYQLVVCTPSVLSAVKSLLCSIVSSFT